MTSPVNQATNNGVLRLQLRSMLDEHLDRADECKQDDPALEGHLTAATQLDAALRRMKNGTYGICRQCHEPISPRRLEALPAAALCIDCQRMPRPFLI